jgi:parvulin-like peptidyl-prolyl isomerase
MTGTLVLLCAAGTAPAQKTEANEPAATVNGEVITKGELAAQLKKDGPMPESMPEGQRKQLQMAKLHGLINDALLRQFLEKNAPPIEDKAIDACLTDLNTQLQHSGKSLADLCREMNLSHAQMRANFAAILRWNAYAEKNLSEQDLEKYYQNNKVLFDQVRVRVSEIVMRVPTQVPASERELVRKQLKELRDKIVANQITFEDAAKQYSQSMTKEQGGDLDWLPYLKGELLPLPDNVLEAAFSLQPGQLSDVLDAEFGLYLIKTTQRDPGHPSEFAKIKQQVREFCVDEMKLSILTQMRKTADLKIHIQ